MQSIRIKWIGIILFGMSFFNGYAQEEEIKNAETAYAAEQYDTAIELYESLLRNYGASS
jgi:hypothetical protein